MVSFTAIVYGENVQSRFQTGTVQSQTQKTGIPVFSETLVNTELLLLEFLGYRYHLYPLSLLRNQLVYRFQIDKLQTLANTQSRISSI